MMVKVAAAAILFLAVAEGRVVTRQTIAGCTGSGQSCDIACISGSTGLTCPSSYTVSGGTQAGLQCIAQYNPNFNSSSVTISKKRDLPEPFGKRDGTTLVKRQAYTSNDLLDGICGDNLLIFARGTTELGNMGETVGPALQEGLSAAGLGQWAFQGVTYDATVDGDDCLGLPGGAVATKYIEQAATQCPNTKIVLSGYSEGAMVAHNGVGYASASSKAKVVGVVVFGDPFNGAPIAGYPTSQIKTYCITGDEVCSGDFVIGVGHLSYTLVDTTLAVEYIQSIV